MAEHNPIDGDLPEDGGQQEQSPDLMPEGDNRSLANPSPGSANGNSSRVATVLVDTVSNFLTLVNWRNVADYRPIPRKAGLVASSPEPGLATVSNFLAAINWSNDPNHPRLGGRVDEPGEAQTVGTEFLAENLMQQFAWD